LPLPPPSSRFPDPSPTEFYPLSLHDALPILLMGMLLPAIQKVREAAARTKRLSDIRSIGTAFHSHQLRGAGLPSAAAWTSAIQRDRKSTRLNSSHQIISYAVFCLKKKNIEHT